MSLLLPRGHPLEHDLGSAPSERSDVQSARIGIINLMPRGEIYEGMLLRALAGTSRVVEPRFVRLLTHGYKSTDHAHLDRWYETFDRTLATGPLDGLILTGAPIEHLAFGEVRYWRELRDIIAVAGRHIGSTLGICWGALALGETMGVGREPLDEKLFGVFEHRFTSDGADLLGRIPTFLCPHSRHAGVVESDLERASSEGRAIVLARGAVPGATIFATPDLRFVGHLGHPEYQASRLAYEWKRDRDRGRADVPLPEGLDIELPKTTWADHTTALFDRWVDLAVRNRS